MLLDSSNLIYEQVRLLFKTLTHDIDQFGTPQWNPLKGLIRPGEKVVIKPNLVFHRHPIKDHGIESMVTHGSVIRPLVDYVWKAMEEKGEIVIADVPLQTADWEELLKITGLGEMVEFLHGQGVHVRLLDLRREHAKANPMGVITHRTIVNGDPAGYRVVDLGTQSMLYPVRSIADRLSITDYPVGTVSKHHCAEMNQYLIAQTVLDADLFINVSKLKTHKKGGVTLSMKNLIGINGDKSWIAHHREGTPSRGGDEFPRIGRMDWVKYRLFILLKRTWVGQQILTLLLRMLRSIDGLLRMLRGSKKRTLLSFQSITEGSWYGNDTLWRVILDLNRILRYADREGHVRSMSQRKTFCLIDGIWAGEGNGPMQQTPKHAGVLLGGLDALQVDRVGAYLMGFDPAFIPQLSHASEKHPLPLDESKEDLIVWDRDQEQSFGQWKIQPTLAFRPPVTWIGHLEHDYRDPSDLSSAPETLRDSHGE